jgi:hypothetical protein
VTHVEPSAAFPEELRRTPVGRADEHELALIVEATVE